MAISSVLGYPRIGKQREWKKALEAYWAGKLDEESLHSTMQKLRLEHLGQLNEQGIDLIPVHDFTYYDHVLDTAVMFGLVPPRFGYTGGQVPLTTYFAMARGKETAAACEMTKWFNTNYHYIVPELRGVAPQLTENKPLQAYREAKERLGIDGKPVLLGLYTFLRLSKGYKEEELDSWIEKLLPLYIQILQELEGEGVRWVQIDEPVWVTQIGDQDLVRIHRIYESLTQAAPKLNIMLQTYFEAVDRYPDLISLPVRGIGLDLVHGYEGNLEALHKFGFPEDKVLGAGVVDGRNIWRSSLFGKLKLIEELTQLVPTQRLIIQTSCSLLHTPVTVKLEKELPPVLREALAFADEKVEEILLLTQAIQGERSFPFLSRFHEAEEALQRLKDLPERGRKEVQQAVLSLHDHPAERQIPFDERYPVQLARWKLPLLPTTTIGSFPQSAEVRRARQLWRKGEWSAQKYDSFIRDQIDDWIQLQEELGLDVLVHGEFERTDMVEFFGEKLGGFAFTQFGWVQSYGSRCVKPPVIYADVEFLEPMTIAETVYAQSRTQRPVKGMLTGPVTILNWSFVRDDLSRKEVAYQLAYALRQEVEALEAAGIGLIQVDEPAVREGLPLKKVDQEHYLNWAVKAFRIVTCTVQPETQVHTHMCYCEFHDMIDAIQTMDADVISIETSRSHGELIEHFERKEYSLGIGLGVYDIHSPRVPDREEMSGLLDRALRVLDPRLFWINPDCGLKTRGRQETIESLRNMVEAARLGRERYTLSYHTNCWH